MPTKADLNDVNLLQLFEAHKRIDQAMSNAEGTDKKDERCLAISTIMEFAQTCHSNQSPSLKWDSLYLRIGVTPIFNTRLIN